ncbi:MATE family efflux transporter [Paracidovorax citrulli]|uniref:MATE efflux family protein n=2 Tax=Paracidovorax citrulli TaxID=80869 RepID=A1TTR0_PARC0|nr:MATE family efflux transporter [Paracidovorax citrulli]ABM34348.1 MATE efflux family protein [Paracidovorax citrulli AAC00-1]ATG93824.1 hypothetical protein CQB05_07120 [Paracidovorax citrulli]MVT27978.1 hypothetical protein [Paracidovorax citrulli]MVT37175.1 hypothetical protein [Paracidovorax citrulli]PVY63789.1 MATE family multidrug resistance protein [Paracidovorax citrulli]
MRPTDPSSQHAPAHAPWRSEARASLSLTLHLLIGQTALMSLPLADLLSVASLGRHALAAVGLVNSVAALLTLVCFGVLQAVAPLAGAALGRGGGPAVARKVVGDGLRIASGLGVLNSGLLLLFAVLLPGLGQEPEVARQAQHYAAALAPGMLAAAWLAAWRVGLPVLGRVRSLSITLSACAALHFAANHVLVHGMAGLPALGMAGLGWSYAVTYGTGVLVLHLLDRRPVPQGAGQPHAPSSARALLRIGLPIGAVMGIEYMLFTGSTVLMGRHGSSALAAHAVALQWVTLAFVIPLAASHTVLTRLSLAIGHADADAARRSTAAACVIAGVFHALVAGAWLWVPEAFASALLPVPIRDRDDLVATAAALLRVGALLQALNGFVVVLAAVLRACRDTSAILWQVLFGYWVIGLGSAALLGSMAGPAGIWWGMALGFGVALVLVLHRVRRRLTRLNDVFQPTEEIHAQSR